MVRISIALQLYSIREECTRDLLGTLKAVAKMGYDGVEFAGYYGRSAEDLRGILDNLKLKAAGTHIRLETLLGNELEKTIEYNRILGNDYLIVPALPEEMRGSQSGITEAARLMSKAAERLRSTPFRVGYHAEPWDFKSINNKLAWDIFFEAASPEIVMQLDTGNAMHGGLTATEVLDIMKRYPGRALTVHLKEYTAKNDKALIGEGDVEWNKFFKLCESIGNTQWFVIEQESYAYPPLECAARCIKNLRKMLKN